MIIDGQNIDFIFTIIYIWERGYLSFLRTIPFGQQLITLVKPLLVWYTGCAIWEGYYCYPSVPFPLMI